MINGAHSVEMNPASWFTGVVFSPNSLNCAEELQCEISATVSAFPLLVFIDSSDYNIVSFLNSGVMGVLVVQQLEPSTKLSGAYENGIIQCFRCPAVCKWSK